MNHELLTFFTLTNINLSSLPVDQSQHKIPSGSLYTNESDLKSTWPSTSSPAPNHLARSLQFINKLSNQECQPSASESPSGIGLGQHTPMKFPPPTQTSSTEPSFLSQLRKTSQWMVQPNPAENPTRSFSNQKPSFSYEPNTPEYHGHTFSQKQESGTQFWPYLKREPQCNADHDPENQRSGNFSINTQGKFLFLLHFCCCCSDL